MKINQYMNKSLIIILLISQYTFADSPLTSTVSYKVPEVLEASTSNGTLTDKHFNFNY